MTTSLRWWKRRPGMSPFLIFLTFLTVPPLITVAMSYQSHRAVVSEFEDWKRKTHDDDKVKTASSEKNEPPSENLAIAKGLIEQYEKLPEDERNDLILDVPGLAGKTYPLAIGECFQAAGLHELAVNWFTLADRVLSTEIIRGSSFVVKPDVKRASLASKIALSSARLAALTTTDREKWQSIAESYFQYSIDRYSSLLHLEGQAEKSKSLPGQAFDWFSGAWTSYKKWIFNKMLQDNDGWKRLSRMTPQSILIPESSVGTLPFPLKEALSTLFEEYGLFQVSRGNHERALELLEQAKENIPNDLPSILRLNLECVRCLLEMGQLERAHVVNRENRTLLMEHFVKSGELKLPNEKVLQLSTIGTTSSLADEKESHEEFPQISRTIRLDYEQLEAFSQLIGRIKETGPKSALVLTVSLQSEIYDRARYKAMASNILNHLNQGE